jgi:two-component system sensor kinase FixL
MVALSREAGEGTRDEKQLRAVLNALPMALLLIDQQGIVRYANYRAAALFDHARDTMPGRAIAALLPDATGEAWSRTCRAEPDDGHHACHDATALRGGGALFPVELLFNTLRLDGALYVVIAVNDLTGQRQAEQELAFERESMAHMSRVTLIGEISGSMAHELNQPLAAILSNAQAGLRILRRDPGDITEIREILQDIVDNDQRAGEVISRLRGLLRRECRSFGTLTVNALVHDAIRIIRHDLINRGVEYRLDLAVPFSRIHGDAVQLQQVLLNLIINACDAMSDSPRRVLTVRTDRLAHGRIGIEVRDTGPGIAAERLEAIFAPFHTTKPNGMGMGLAICRTLLRAHGGDIHAGNLPEGGGCFRIELPLLE